MEMFVLLLLTGQIKGKMDGMGGPKNFMVCGFVGEREGDGNF